MFHIRKWNSQIFPAYPIGENAHKLHQFEIEDLEFADFFGLAYRRFCAAKVHVNCTSSK